MDASPGVSLPLLSPQQANHFCGLFWNLFHFCISLGYAEQKGQITPLQNEIVMAPLFPSLAVPNLSFHGRVVYGGAERTCFGLLYFFACSCMLTDCQPAAHSFTLFHLPPQWSQIQRGSGSRQACCFPTGALLATSIALPTNTVLYVLEGGGSAGLLAQMHGSNSFYMSLSSDLHLPSLCLFSSFIRSSEVAHNIGQVSIIISNSNVISWILKPLLFANILKNPAPNTAL